jgi:hypothetical protein
MKEKSAKDVKGFLMYSPFHKRHIFRVYDEKNKGNFTDYQILAEDVEIKISSDYYALLSNDNNYILDYSKKALKK